MNYFSPANSALVLIDHQVGTMGLIKNHALETVRRNTLALARMAVILDMPVVLTSSQEDQFQGPLMKELEDILPHAHAARIKRAGVVNAWDDAAFAGAVRATGRSNLIMAGVTTDVCLVFPAISARSEGFGVQAVLDASGSPFGLSEEMARRRMELAGVILTATITVFAELAHDWSSKEGTQLQKLLLEEVLAEVLAGVIG
ncbi:isochorismatase family protein [Massilia pseudoviolaceinigra]|uniref:isochorismatase family protein n=1 Tax=Massilia pseudoviolaceinigra TaxID=3057165 RepID=UPI002796C864|nr:isochorismatase family protein [Massilia sp. CCM 9206]MDQ1923631.1 isochorismatase family protein [Massilia sp. CCM 9206]